MSTQEIVYTVHVHDEGPDGLWAEVEELPGCFASGFSPGELKEALIEAIGLYLSTPDSRVTVELKDDGADPEHKRFLVTA